MWIERGAWNEHVTKIHDRIPWSRIVRSSPRQRQWSCGLSRLQKTSNLRQAPLYSSLASAPPPSYWHLPAAAAPAPVPVSTVTARMAATPGTTPAITATTPAPPTPMMAAQVPAAPAFPVVHAHAHTNRGRQRQPPPPLLPLPTMLSILSSPSALPSVPPSAPSSALADVPAAASLERPSAAPSSEAPPELDEQDVAFLEAMIWLLEANELEADFQAGPWGAPDGGASSTS